MTNSIKTTLFLGLVAMSAFAWAQDAKQALTDRVRTFWNARAAGDWATEYRFLQPGDTQGGSERDFIEFRNGKAGNFRFSSVEIGEVAVAQRIGWVEVKYNLQWLEVPELPPDHLEIWDIWEERNGQWYPMAREERKQVPQLPPERRPAAEEASLLKRAEGFWKAREAQDRGLLYAYLEPDFQTKVPREQFVPRQAKYSYLSHRIEWVEVIEDRGRVKVAYVQKKADTKAKVEPAAATTIEDWYRIHGQWYRSASGPGED